MTDEKESLFFEILGINKFLNATCHINTNNSMHVTLKWLGTSIFESRYEKTGLQGFRPGPTQTGLYSHRRWLEACNF